ncbi:MAG: hypothetical protein B1H13_11460 [Desulfobacteraceae bacterium 4484_190.3]|nr:MAG: hypothetical protein B1H13_11460 [Desulfobacteraceae bacterium 4484_190.3]
MTELVKDHLPKILKKQVSAITDVLENMPWIGKVLSTEDKTVRVNGGRDVGMKEGFVFEVYSYGKPLSGGPFTIGQVILLKH